MFGGLTLAEKLCFEFFAFLQSMSTVKTILKFTEKEEKLQFRYIVSTKMSDVI